MEHNPIELFGLTFTHIPEHVITNIESLKREGCVYCNQWIESLGDFRHVRIAFSREEIDEYVKRSWAYELWIRSNMPQLICDTPDIDKDFASEADSYVMELETGEKIKSHHCFASFLGKNLERLVCMTPDDRRVVIESIINMQTDSLTNGNKI